MNPSTYGGDEVSAIVIDIGTQTTRAGFAGEETPRSVIPTSYGYIDHEVDLPSSTSPTSPTTNNTGTNGQHAHDRPESSNPAEPTDASGDQRMRSASPSGVPTKKKHMERRYFMGDQGVDLWREGMEVGSMIRDGIVTDPQALPHLLHHTLHTSLQVDPTQHPLLLTEPAWNTSRARELVAEMAFEGEGVPGFYIACSSVLSAFAAGKGTALIVDIGSDLVSVVPVCDGYAIRSGTKRQPLSLTLLNSQIAHFLAKSHPEATLLPHHLVKSRKPVPLGAKPSVQWNTTRMEKTTESWKTYQKAKVVDGWRESCAEVMVGGYSPDLAGSKTKTYEFPDGYGAQFGPERYALTESLFNPEAYLDKTIPPPEQLYATPSAPTAHPLHELRGLADLVHDSVFAVDSDHRAVLLQNIVLVGGGSTILGLADRLNHELALKIPGSKLKIHAPGNSIERRHSVWLGGSILASLGTFHQLWVGADEWKEHGPAILAQRCK